MTIHQYDRGVFTHGGQTTVVEFGTEIMNAGTEIAKFIGLNVIVGYHGTDPNGDWDHDFDVTERANTQGIKDNHFKQVNLTWKTGPHGMTDDEIRAAVQSGNTFFTWCDSDNKVRSVVGAGMPAKIKDW